MPPLWPAGNADASKLTRCLDSDVPSLEAIDLNENELKNCDGYDDTPSVSHETDLKIDMDPRADSLALQMKDWNTSCGIKGLLTDSGVPVPSILSTPQIPRCASAHQNLNPKIIRPFGPDSSMSEMEGGSPADLLIVDVETTPVCNTELSARKATEMEARDKPQSDQSFLDPPPLISAEPNWLVLGEGAQTIPCAAPTRFPNYFAQTSTRLHWPDVLPRILHQINLGI
ncbi:hypothetical protein C8R46DRAFT_1040674 [Mycena filopes]|nr:hypothetical protein C8R46DRAFT_1040674 [Mycena filopes]